MLLVGCIGYNFLSDQAELEQQNSKSTRRKGLSQKLSPVILV